jgi:hypothetical protein
LMPRAEGPFEVLERVNDNAYKIDLPGDYGVSATFNVADLAPYHPDLSLPDLRIKSLQQGEDDGNLPIHDQEQSITSPSRPRTRSQVKRMANLMAEEQEVLPGLFNLKLPGFVHVIS